MELRQREPRLVLPKLTTAARGEACTVLHPDHCLRRPDTVVAAHCNWGKPVGEKDDDCMIVFACSGCHDWLDRTRDPERMRMWIQAHRRTLRRLFDRGLLKVG